MLSSDRLIVSTTNRKINESKIDYRKFGAFEIALFNFNSSTIKDNL